MDNLKQSIVYAEKGKATINKSPTGHAGPIIQCISHTPDLQELEGTACALPRELVLSISFLRGTVYEPGTEARNLRAN